MIRKTVGAVLSAAAVLVTGLVVSPAAAAEPPGMTHDSVCRTADCMTHN